MALRIFTILIIVLAIVMGLLALFLTPAQAITLIGIRDFFDVSLPVLFFGALIKYICTWSCSCCRKKNDYKE